MWNSGLEILNSALEEKPMNETLRTFLQKYEEIQHELADDVVVKGENGTGYFNGLVKIKAPDHIEASKFTDSHGRRGIVFYTTIGNVVVFERYTPDGSEDVTFVSNGPKWWELISDGPINSNVMDKISSRENYPRDIVDNITSSMINFK